MASNNTRGRILRSQMNLDKQNLIGRELFSGEINRSYEKFPRYKVTDNKNMSWTISSQKSLEDLKSMDKYKGCSIVPTV